MIVLIIGMNHTIEARNSLHEVESLLRSAGHKVINPVAWNSVDIGFYNLRKYLQALSECSAVYLADNWFCLKYASLIQQIIKSLDLYRIESI